MWDFILNRLFMHGYGFFVWGSVFFCLGLLIIYFIYIKILSKRIMRRIKKTIDINYD